MGWKKNKGEDEETIYCSIEMSMKWVLNVSMSQFKVKWIDFMRCKDTQHATHKRSLMCIHFKQFHARQHTFNEKILFDNIIHWCYRRWNNKFPFWRRTCARAKPQKSTKWSICVNKIISCRCFIIARMSINNSIKWNIFRLFRQERLFIFLLLCETESISHRISDGYLSHWNGWNNLFELTLY